MKALLLTCLPALLLAAAWPAAVRAQNTNPIAQNDAATTFVGDLLILDVLVNDSDADGDALTITRLPTLPTQGEATIGTDGTTQVILYRSRTNAGASDSFTYEISDGNGGTAVATVFLTIRVIRPPVAQDDAVSLFSFQTVQVDVLANDSDPDGTPLQIIDLPLLPGHGTAAIINTGGGQRVSYNPDDAFEGADSLSYVIADTDNATDTAFVFFTVAINQPPDAVNDSLTILINASFEVNVLANDSDLEGDALSVLGVSRAPQHGQAVVVDGMRVRYTPQPGFLGTDSFEYTLSDGFTRGGTLVADRATVVVRVLPPGGSFEAVLSGTNEVPSTRSRATGLIVATLTGAQITFGGTFTRLDSDFSPEIGANVYLGHAGETGEVLLPLTVRLSPGNRNGIISTEDNAFALNDEEIEALFARRLYINIHTRDLVDGAVRGQLLPSEPTSLLRAVLSGRATTPANDTPAVGGIVAERYDNLLIVTGAFSNLASAVTKRGKALSGVRLFRGDPGVPGTPLFDLFVDFDTDRRGGSLSAARNTFTLTEDQIQLLEDGQLHVAVETTARPGGAIRGQLRPLSTRVFEVFLAGANEAPPLVTPGTGGLIGLLDGTTLAISGAIDGLGSPVDLSLRNGAHIHQAPPGANGDILFELAPVLSSGGRNGFFSSGGNTVTLTPDQLDALFDGQFYVNVHTLDHPGGALRGQLLPGTNLAPGPATVASPVDGAAVDVSGTPGAPFVPRWFPASDVNGNPIYYRWQLALDAAFDDLVMTSDLMTATQFETTVGDVVEALAARGLGPADNVRAFHRVVSTDGSLTTRGPAARVILGDDTATNAEESAGLPERFAVQGNYPNPFNPVTTIEVDVPQAARVHVEVYDVRGRRVLTTPDRRLEAGSRRALQVDAASLASGVYLYRVVARTATATFTGSGRLTLLK